jgi:hypothetical protein
MVPDENGRNVDEGEGEGFIFKKGKRSLHFLIARH